MMSSDSRTIYGKTAAVRYLEVVIAKIISLYTHAQIKFSISALQCYSAFILMKTASLFSFWGSKCALALMLFSHLTQIWKMRRIQFWRSKWQFMRSSINLKYDVNGKISYKMFCTGIALTNHVIQIAHFDLLYLCCAFTIQLYWKVLQKYIFVLYNVWHMSL